MLKTIIAVAALAVPLTAQAAVLDFEDLAHGDAIDAVAVGGISATVTTIGGTNQARAFDTRERRTQDPDLEGPFTGPVTDPGLVLIIQSDDRGVSAPNDERSGGVVTFTFDRLVNVLGFAGLDDIVVTASTEKGGAATLRVASDNESGRLSGLGAEFQGVRQLSFDFSGSGAIDGIEVSAVPVPAALPLMLAGLGAMGLAARRRRD